MSILMEGLRYHDLAGLVSPEVSIDEYSAAMGDDADIITIAFKVKGEMPANELVEWFERGYEWVLDAQVSDGEITNGVYLVFVEIERRTHSPEKILELIDELDTLTGLQEHEWELIINDERHECSIEVMQHEMFLSPKEYNDYHDQDMSAIARLAGIKKG